MTKNQPKPHYGYYSLYMFVALSAIIFIIGAVITIWVCWPPGIVVIGFGLYFAISYVFSSLSFKETEPFNPSPFLELKGNEQVLDVGCGLGKTTIGVAKHLTTGKATGIDIWSAVEIPGNSSERAYLNAQTEGVQNKVEFKTGNVLSIPFPDNSFDLVTSSSVINNLQGDPAKIKAFHEILRVLRSGGKFLLIEPLRDRWGFLTFTLLGVWMLLPKDKWIALLERAGFTNLKYEYREHLGMFLVEKPE
jgi:SAM-dependent methyltransferase